MSDIRFDGHAPKSALGKEFWFESDWWYAFMEVIDDLMQDKFPIDENFYEDCDFCPRTPHFDETTSQRFAAELSALVDRGSAKTSLENYFREDPLYVVAAKQPGNYQYFGAGRATLLARPKPYAAATRFFEKLFQLTI